ncbi:MAG TPA: molybdenum ABC transporter ATP-binding protein [Thermoanaerobaculia bacterium]|nr:molybdenum ABC transporter ATP-binding protein [Thermoanaerobaculia bacterium]
MSAGSQTGREAAGGLRIAVRLPLPGLSLEVDLRLPGSGVTAIFGPSGAGKSTLLRIVAGLERRALGVVALAGEVWQGGGRSAFVPTHRRGVGYVFQEGALFPHLTVRGNLEYGLARTPPPRRRVPVDRAVEWLGLGGLLDRRPQRLSGGERQRVAVARALLCGPRLLLLDEPLASLDATGKAAILPWLERLHRELSVPVLYVTHALEEVLRLADRVVLLEAGRVVATGPVTELASRLQGVALVADDEVAAVADGRVEGMDAGGDLTLLRVAGASLRLPRVKGAQPGERRRVRVLARDVSLALAPPGRTSILNVLPATVVEVAGADTPSPLVTVDVGGTRLLARISRHSLRELGLAPGQAVFAQIKGVALL